MPNKHSLIAIAILALVAVATALPLAPRAQAGGVKPQPARVSTNFRPSKHGFEFKNPRAKPDDPLFDRLTSGRCGGMSYGSLDYFSAKAAPGSRADVDRFIRDRSTDSILANAGRFLLWSVWPTHSDSRLVGSIGVLTREEELPKLAEALSHGPVPLGLVRANGIRDIRRNHQVVAYGFRLKGDTAIVRVYDPTHPKSDEVTLEFDVRDPAAPITEYRSDWVVAEWRGFFIEDYSPMAPPVTRTASASR